MKTFPTLYSRTSKGAVQQWTMVCNGGEYWSEEGIVGGKITKNKPTVCRPKNVGKANETSPEEQAESEAQSKWTKKQNEGYVADITEVDSVSYQEPMLAKQWEDYREKVVYPVYVDDKRNGTRCNYKNGILISRKNKQFHTVPHILSVLSVLRQKYPSIFIDGELYNEIHKEHLNRLVKLVSVKYQPKDLTPELLAESERIVEFHIYDSYGYDNVTKETPFIERRKRIKELIGNLKYLFVLPYKVCKNNEEVEVLKEESRRLKREGIIIRWGDCPYEHKRSKYLLKYKNFISEEFRVVRIEEGNGNWAGCAKQIFCTNKDGKEFCSNIEGSMEEMRELLKNRDNYIGKMATIEFQGYSEYGIPQIGYLRAFRGYE